MKLTILVDNNTLIDNNLRGEPGLSIYIEDGEKKILFDAGYSDLFIENAQQLSINPLDVDFVVLSHGHLDHIWGLVPLVQLYSEAVFKGQRFKKPRLVTHPHTFAGKTYDDSTEIGSLLSRDRITAYFQTTLSKEPVCLTERMVFLGEIERTNDFEVKKPPGKIRESDKDDFLIEDSAMAYKSSRGLVIITGCSHSGICNIVEYAMKVCGDDRVVDIVGGFHLLNPPRKQLRGTVEYMKALKPDSVHACHCTDINSKEALAKVVDLMHAGVGLRLEY